jgi:hypothetical protein
MASPTALTANNKKRKTDSSFDYDCRDHAHVRVAGDVDIVDGGGTAATTTTVCDQLTLTFWNGLRIPRKISILGEQELSSLTSNDFQKRHRYGQILSKLGGTEP